MSKQDLRNNINLIKRKLTRMDNLNEDTINEIVEDVKGLLKFKLDTETSKTHTRKHNKNNSTLTQHFQSEDLKLS